MPPYSKNRFPLCFIPKSLLNVETVKSPICENIEIIIPRPILVTAEKSKNFVSNRQNKQQNIICAILPVSVLFGLISGVIYFLGHFCPNIDAK